MSVETNEDVNNAVLELLSGLHSVSAIEPTHVGRVLGWPLQAVEGEAGHHAGVKQLRSGGRVAAQVYPDVLDATRRRLELRFDAGAQAGECIAPFAALSAGLASAGFTHSPRGDGGSLPAPDTFARDGLVVEVDTRGSGDATPCIRSIVVR